MGEVIKLPERDLDTVAECPICGAWEHWAIVLDEDDNIVEFVCECGWYWEPDYS